MDTITVGEIIKAVGIKGEVKIKPLTDDIERFKKIRQVYINGQPYQIYKIRLDRGYAVAQFYGINDRDMAQSLVSKFVDIDRLYAVDLDEDAYFIVDIIGSKFMLDDGSQIGIIKDVLQYGAADVFEIDCFSKKIARCPFLKKLIKVIDTETKVVIAYKKVFDEVCVYED